MTTTAADRFFVVLCFFMAFAFATSGHKLADIAGATRSGNASAITANFQGNVEITIKDGSNSYSKSQAEMVLKNFFSTHQPKGFTMAHQGASPEAAKYFIGTLNTSTGNYRTYVLAKSAGGTWAIQEIRF